MLNVKAWIILVAMTAMEAKLEPIRLSDVVSTTVRSSEVIYECSCSSFK